MANLRYAKIGNNLYLNELSVDRPTAPVKVSKPSADSDSINHLWIIDRSGSMSGTLAGLIDDLIDRVNTHLGVGDIVTVGWFSCPGNYRFALKGYKISSDADKGPLVKALKELKETLGSTCFSEILTDLSKVVEELSVFSNTFALMFLSDGYPTVWDHKTEVARISSALKALSGRVQSSLLVGYGNYYNKELLTQMAQEVGGSLIHAGDLPTFHVQFKSYVEEIRDGGSKVPVTPPFKKDDLSGLFTVQGKRITLLDKQDDGQVLVPVPRRGKALVYTLSKAPAKGAIEAKLALQDESDSLAKGAYAAAYVLTQKLKTDIALEVLGAIGDKALVDDVSNAFTPDDYGKAESHIARAVERKDARFKAGWMPGCVPDKHAYCALDAIDLLMEDEEARLYPYQMEYKKIGRNSEYRDGYAKFHANPNPSCPFSDLTLNEKFLNLSVRVKIDGYIELDDEAKKYKLPKQYNTHIWRNYTIIKDGFLNVNTIPVSMSKDTYLVLKTHGLVDDAWKKDTPLSVHLSRVPVMNRAMAEGRTSAKALCAHLVKELELEAQIKVLKHELDKLRPEGKKIDGVSKEASEYLKSVGVTYSGFSPPSTQLPSTDTYLAKEFQVKIAKFSSLPRVDEVADKVKAINEAKAKNAKYRDLTESQQLIACQIAYVASLLDGKKSDASKIKVLEDSLAVAKVNLRSVRAEVQRTKFAVILSKRWFSEFTTRDNAELDYKGYTFTFSLREVSLAI